jgi:threonine synthase
MRASVSLTTLLGQVAYHSRDIEGMECRYANPPVSVKEDLGAVMDAISSRFSLKHR